MGYYICEARKGDRVLHAVTMQGLIRELSKYIDHPISKRVISRIKDEGIGQYNGYIITITKEEELEDMWLEQYKKAKKKRKKKIAYTNYVLLRNPVTHGLGRLYESL